jgi:hypothetical protein
VLGCVAAAVLAVLFVAPPVARAAAPPAFVKVPEDGIPGVGAGQFDLPEGIAADPGLPGHVYVVDRPNARIEEFTAWGEFVKAWGWNVIKGSVGGSLQTCTAQTGCQAGSKGGGAGQFRVPRGIAVDGAGNVYVVESGNHRVQKFDPTGGVGEDEAQFTLTFGFKVNKTKEGGSEAEANLCTAASGDVCQEGSEGTGLGKVGAEYFNKIAVSSADNAVFLGEGEQIQRFELGGAFKEAIKEGPLVGKSIGALAVDLSGNLYAAFGGQAEVIKLKPNGPTAEALKPPEFKPESAAERPRALAVDGHGNLYVVEDALGEEPARVQEYDASGNCLLCGSAGEGGKPGFDRSSESRPESIAASSACEPDATYIVHFAASPQRAFFRAFGQAPNPLLCPPPKAPPAIDAQYAFSVESEAATLKVQINPRFWSGPIGTTTYYLQYATEACFESGGWEAGCVKQQPAPPGAVLKSGAVNEDVSATLVLEGLSPGTAYRYRFVAEGSGAPGEEVFGVGGVPGVPGKDATFITFREPAGELCPENEGFRFGPSALLPDCRAYEMVTPIDKEGGDIVALPETATGLPGVLEQSAESGERLAYGSARSFGGAAAAPRTTQYIAARKAGDSWVTHPVSPPRGRSFYDALNNFDTEFKAFSPDLCEGWFQSYAELPSALEPLAPPAFSDLFRRSDEECGGAAYDSLNRTEPTLDPGIFRMELKGLSGDGRVAAFIARDALAEGGSAGLSELYASREGAERFLCVLPGGAAWSGYCTAGGSAEESISEGKLQNRGGNVAGAVSEDGRRFFWTALGKGNFGGPGPIYLREDPFGEGAECSEEGAPCTVAVSKAAEEEAGTIGVGSEFWAAAKDGSKAIFTTGGKLYEYRLGDESTQTHPIAGEVLGLMGQSADLARVYLASREELPSEENENEEHAEVGQPNLYYWEGGQFHFIGALGIGDLSNLSPIAAPPNLHTARVAADGLHATFMSSAPLTGYDNADAASGKADAEVFVYDAAANGGKGKLACASCNPSGARPRGVLAKEGIFNIQAAAKIPVPENQLYASRVLSEDGHRLYFESFDPLTLRDSNGRKDVYQWEEAGAGGCQKSSPTYSPLNGGCVDLVSSGKSDRESTFVDASPSGRDVFFATLSGLLPQDPGLVDIYDAREGGGLPTPPSPPPPCEAEACQHPVSPPAATTPASESYEGPEDGPEAKKKAAKCPKGKHRVNGKCVKKKAKAKHAKSKSKAKGRTGR